MSIETSGYAVLDCQTEGEESLHEVFVILF